MAGESVSRVVGPLPNKRLYILRGQQESIARWLIMFDLQKSYDAVYLGLGVAFLQTYNEWKAILTYF